MELKSEDIVEFACTHWSSLEFVWALEFLAIFVEHYLDCMYSSFVHSEALPKLIGCLGYTEAVWFYVCKSSASFYQFSYTRIDRSYIGFVSRINMQRKI